MTERLRLALLLSALMTMGTLLSLAQMQIQQQGKRKIASAVQPHYPELARSIRLRGTVKLLATVAPDGRVKSVDVVGGHPILAAAAVGAVSRWRFEAAAVESKESVVINFNP